MQLDDSVVNKLNAVLRTCRKIEEAIFEYDIDICKEFCQNDPNRYGLVSAPIFSGIIGKYKNAFELSDLECRELSDYFSLRDGRVNYRQFCKSICSETRKKGKRRDYFAPSVVIDPMRVNVISNPEEKRRLCLLLIKISQIKNIPVLPYFQDYDLINDKAGVVTISHFSRILNFMKIPLSDADFLLILKRYIKDSYLVNYAAFCKHLSNINEYLREHNLMTSTNIIFEDFPGRLVDLELPQLPNINGCDMQKKIFKDSCKVKDDRSICNLIFCLQKLIHQKRICIREFMEGFDHLHTGTITKNQFERSLHAIGVGHILTQRDFQMLCNRFIDPIDTNRVMWKKFEEEINKVLTKKTLEKTPQLIVKSPPQTIKPRPGFKHWVKVEKKPPDAGVEALKKIQIRIKNRRLYLHPYFRNYDRLNMGHIGYRQADQIFVINGILLSPNELRALHDRYGNELGFHYTKFLEEADPAEYAIPKLKTAKETLNCPTYKEEDPKNPDRLSDEYFKRLLSNIKRQTIIKNISIIDFMQDYDRHREGEILTHDFVSALEKANIKLDQKDVLAICEIYKSPRRGCAILYRDFCKTIDLIIAHVETSPDEREIIAIPPKHLANLDCLECFLSFDERTQCSHGLMKLARRPDEIATLSAAFKDFDRENCGTIRQNQFLRALTSRGMNHMISTREFEAICKCFGVTRGLHLEFNYREFLKILNVLHVSGQVIRSY